MRSQELSTSMSKELTRTLYKALMQTTKSLPQGSPLRLRLPLAQSQAQWMGAGKQFGFLPPRSAARELFPAERGYPSLPPEADAPELEPEALRGLVRSVFRTVSASAAAAPKEVDGVDLGLHALKVLHNQLAMAKRSSAVRTDSDTGAAVLVEATSEFMGRDSSNYVFSYRLRLTNVGAVPVQVIGRSWDIRNADGSSHASVPRGSPGIVGQTPRLLPNGDCFEYASGTSLATPTGTVEGSLQMMSLGQGDERPFDALVGRFECVADS